MPTLTRRTLPTLLAALLLWAHAQDIGISPARLDLSAAPGQTITETITVVTSSREPQQVRASVSDWTLDPLGRLAYFPPGSLAYSASPWLLPETTDVLLEPNSVREFRLSVTVPEDAGLSGTYQTMLFFQVVPSEAGDEGIGVVTTTRIGLTIYLTIAGTEQPSAELVDFFQDSSRNLTVAIANTGNTVMRLGGYIELRDEAGTPQQRLEVPNIPVLRESERELSLPLPAEVAPGFYVALALVEDSRGGLLVGELPFTLN